MPDDERIRYLAKDGDASLPESERVALDELQALLAAAATWAEPEPGLEDRIVAAIAQEAQAAPAQAEPATTRRRRAPWPRWRWPAYSLSAATAALAAVAVVLVLNLGHGSSPLQFSMIMSGTSLAPSAHGSATLTKLDAGWRIQLDATGLPRRSNGRYYEAWLKNRLGVLVPVGTFNDAVHVTLWSGVPVTTFRTLTVTTQTDDGNPKSSRRVMLQGTIRTRS